MNSCLARDGIRLRISIPFLYAILSLTCGSPAAHALELYTSGHADLAVRNPNGGNTLEFVYDFSATAIVNGSPVGGTGRIADPALINTIIPESSSLTVPGTFGSAYWRNRLTWYLPPNAVSGVPDLGIGKILTENVFVSDAVSLSFDSFVSRPTGGEFLLANSNGSSIFMDTSPGATSPNNLAMAEHGHYLWFFSQQGQYQIRFRADATLIEGNTPVTAFATYSFTVVPEPSTWALAVAGCLAASLAIRRKLRGKPAS